ncbi:hypothetical protein RMR16_006065 [Agrobacterium sp. rho-13.3]|uniref:hypothetical protein n=1 Tax=Agrobacterium sp. rho-13.3 TaxID=3072980 RepID=UPI002A0C2C08|nr:hypothetical protein [Agrobacterium sp. rho-13.3]MDX8309408.1 hypothetical protein [Agrobacterium sp. rho-13.3]
MTTNIDEMTIEVNPSKMMVAGQFSQVTGQVFSSFLPFQTPVSYTFSLAPITADVTLRSKPDVTCHAGEKILISPPRDHITDCENLTKMELRKKYKNEANSHRNMKSRLNDKGIAVDPAFEDFRSYLRKVGPIPAQGATVDRVNNPDPDYAEGKVAWADRRTQNNNKSDTLIFRDPDTNEVYTASRLAKLQGVDGSTIRQRNKRGWTDAEIIRGSREKTSPAKEVSHVPTYFSPKAVSPAREISGAEREFRLTAEIYRQQREEDGTEAFIPTYEELKELRAECGMPYTEADYENHFRSLWPKHRDHVNFDNLSEDQVQLIAFIDPNFVSSWKSRKELSNSIDNML